MYRIMFKDIYYIAMNKLLLLALVLIIQVRTQKYKKIVHNTDPDARCLDGSPPALYVQQGSQTDKFLIFLEGGGYCQGQTQSQVIQQCYQRSKTIYGSSNLRPDEIEGQGYLSANQGQSQLANWTKIIFTSCDGSFYQGYRSSPIQYKNSSLFFRGSKIVKSNLAYLQKNYNLSKAKKIIWTGASSGAIGAMVWSGYMRQLFQKQKQVYYIIDSGVFLDFPGHGTQNHHYATQLKTLYRLVNLEETTPLEVCNVFYPDNEWKCFLLQYNYIFLLGNFLYVNSQYDNWAIENILKIKCLTNSSIHTGSTMNKCNKQEIDAIEKYRQAYQFLMFELLHISNKNSLWSISCSNNVYASLRITYDSQYEKIPQITGSTVRNTVENFVIKEQERITNMDLMSWPYNHPCAI